MEAAKTVLSPLSDEESRLRQLQQQEILDTRPEPAYDDIASLAALICETPIATISFIDKDREWFKSKVGMEASEVGRGVAFGSHAILGKEALVVSNALNDPRFSENPLVSAGPRIRFYAGVPFASAVESPLGAISVMDYAPRELTPAQIDGLKALARQISDLLASRRMKRILLQSEERLTLILNEAHGGLWDWDIHSDTVYYSSQWKSMLGYSEDEIGTAFSSWKSLIHPEDLEPSMQVIQDYLKGKSKNYEFEYRLKTKDGGYKWVLARGACVKNEQGVPVRMLGWHEDLTEKKEQSRLVREQELRLVHSEKMASLGAMAGGIAHEINNPLTVIEVNAQQLMSLAVKGRLEQSDLFNLSKKIQNTVQRIAKIIKGLRAVAKDGENDPFELVSLKTLVEDTLEFCNARFKHYEIDVKVSPIPEAFMLECRPVPISQVLLNLLNNAFDAIRDSHEKRWISVEVSESRTELMIAVTDSGKGVAAELREKIMQPFFTTKGSGKGSGLGLSLSKGIVESHLGRLFLDPRSSNTRFVIQIPKSQKNARKALEQAALQDHGESQMKNRV